MHIERERENMKRHLPAAASTSSLQQTTGNTPSAFKPAVSLQPTPSVAETPSVPAVGISRNVPTAPVNSSNAANLPKRELKLTVRFMYCCFTFL